MGSKYGYCAYCGATGHDLSNCPNTTYPGRNPGLTSLVNRQSMELERLRKVEAAAKVAMSHIRTSTLTSDIAQIPMDRAADLIEALAKPEETG